MHGEGAGGLEEDENADEEGHVAHAGHDKRLLGGLGGGSALGVEADEEIGAETDQLPEHVEDEQVVDDDEGEHRRGEEGEHGEEPADLGVTAHVGEGVDLHRQRDCRDEADHDEGELVDGHAEGDADVARLEPEALEAGRAVAYDVGGEEPEQGESRRDRGDGERRALERHVPPQEQNAGEGAGGERGRKPGPLDSHAIPRRGSRCRSALPAHEVDLIDVDGRTAPV